MSKQKKPQRKAKQKKPQRKAKQKKPQKQKKPHKLPRKKPKQLQAKRVQKAGRSRVKTAGATLRVEGEGMTTVIDTAAGTVTLELQSDYVSPLQREGRELAEADRYEEAVAKFTEALEEIPQHPGILSDRGRAYLCMKDVQMAFADTRAAVELDPGNALYLNRFAELMSAVGSDDIALKTWETALEINPGNADLLSSRAHHFAAQKSWAEAARDFEGAIKAQPSDVMHHGNLARCLERLGNTKAAEAGYRKAIALDPGHQGPREAYAEFLTDQGRIAAAIEQYEILQRAGADVDKALAKCRARLTN